MTSVHNAAEFVAWLGQAKSGDVVEYHRGNLAEARHIDPYMKAEDELRARQVSDLATEAMKAHEARRVFLLQRVCLEGSAYIAVKASPVPRAPASAQEIRHAAVRAAAYSGMTQEQIARDFGMSHHTVRKIVSAA